MLKHIYYLSIAFLVHSRFPRSFYSAQCTFSDIPKILTSRTNSSFLYLEWEVPLIQDSVLSHQVQLSTPSRLWCSSISIGTPDLDNPFLIQDFSNSHFYLDSFWSSYSDAYTGPMRSCLVSIKTGMVYRVRVRSLSSNCGPSEWSVPLYISSYKNLTGFLEVQGTGFNNPVNSYINLNGTFLFNGSFDGLLLSVIDRCSLSQTFQSIYNTRFNKSAASELASVLRTQNSNSLVILISSGAWEDYFNKDLSFAIWELGGYLTITQARVLHFQPPYFFSGIQPTGRPYAFISVPRQKEITGMNFEVLRNITAYYNYSEVYNAIPTARIRISLVFDPYRQFFFPYSPRIFRINQT